MQHMANLSLVMVPDLSSVPTDSIRTHDLAGCQLPVCKNQCLQHKCLAPFHAQCYAKILPINVSSPLSKEM